MDFRPDPPELVRACDMLREIYWREYGRGWRDATEHVKRVLESPPADYDNSIAAEQRQDTIKPIEG